MGMLSRYAAEASQMTLLLVPEVLDSVDVVPSFNEPLRVIDAVMTEPGYIQRVTASKATRIDNAIWFCWALGIITTWTLPPLVSKPKTGTLPAAPRPRLPLGAPPK